MKKKSHHNPQNFTIKGYLPIRITLPPIHHKNNEDDKNRKDLKDRFFSSFIYVKEHIQKSSPSDSSKNGGAGGAGATLFVANAPANGPIRTDLFLRALFERYGEVKRVTVAQDPRKVNSPVSTMGGDNIRSLETETFREAALSSAATASLGLLGLWSGGVWTGRQGREGDGKFAHVVFTSGKEMKKALKALKREISEGSGAGEYSESPLSIRLDDDVMERLILETSNAPGYHDDGEADEGKKDDEEENAEIRVKKESDHSLTGIQAIAAQARRKTGRHLSRQALMQLCNEAMASFETEEAEVERRAKLAARQPDEEGFITVSHGSAPSFGAANDFEEDRHGGHRRKGGKRTRKRKGGSGAAELTDFYRFQLKETRKKEVQDLKERFEEDLKKVKKLKEERAYRPF